MKTQEELRQDILSLVREFQAAEERDKKLFLPGKTPVSVSGRVYDAEEMTALTEAALDFWLTAGRFAERFERDFAEFVGTKYALLVNSGSSANLLALSALTSPRLGERRLRPGDEVIGVAASFPTTVNPILQNNLVPVFCDVDLGTYNINVDELRRAVGPKTRAIFLAHTLGNPFNLEAVREVARAHNLWVIEDCCDALGATYRGQNVGTFGDLATFSFYPAHQITMGEGGAVVTSNPQLKVIVESLRDWGRDCWCAPGKADTCGKRFGWQLGGLPFGYDHKYIYSHLGYNLKATDLQAAVGVAQLKKAREFIARRRENFDFLRARLARHEKFLILPQAAEQSKPSWFGFLLTVRPDAPFTKREIVAFLEERQIKTRMLFAGNITKQPYFEGREYRAAGDLRNTDLIMTSSFWVGVYPGITPEMRAYVADTFDEFFATAGDERGAGQCGSNSCPDCTCGG
ncbi:lipopolysaccharide biosynthesis protein RfbH [Patescibacteria group bacterium]|nr:MAG: lipopolysaccharide biosynthesis protein RfbH [Patescibacteria group bacterium]